MKERIKNLIEDIDGLTLEEKIKAINELKLELKKISPFNAEPVDCVQWVKEELVIANDYNPNSGALYINENGNINGYNKIKKPNGHTWKSFAILLINSMPPKTQEHYKNKIYKFIAWWKVHGYPDGIPDEADYQMEQKKNVPSWRRICKSLLRNDFWCKELSFTQQKSQAYERYLEMMKEKREKNSEQITFDL